jgi:hypothetical protein
VSGFAISLLIIFFCCGCIGPALAVGPDIPGGVGALPVKAPAVLPSGSVPSQSVPQVLDREVVSPERSSLVQPGIVSGPVMGSVSVPDFSLPGGVSGLHEVTPPVGVANDEQNISSHYYNQPLFVIILKNGN